MAIELDIIHNADARHMTQIPDDSVHLVVTSPPYNVGKEYEESETYYDWAKMMIQVMRESHRVLCNGGRLCINIANTGRKPYRPLHADIHDYAIVTLHDCKPNFNTRGEIIWDKGASAGSSTAWGSFASASNPCLRDVHEYILVFSKGDYGRNGGDSTIKNDDFVEWTKSIWRMPTASAKRVGHPAPYPIELPRRLIELYSFVGDTVLDPFMGSGTTAIAAAQTKRHYIGYELSADYVRLANERIDRERTII